ncbi:hypothetical protein ACWKTS_32665 [Bacillus toyonensis]|uniref:Uncharacterized protein n=2 Tax=Bacillus cereus group TaxID=86661 RepID=A0A9X7C644_BACCE|nr:MULTISPECIES: hypothetical protein [Bacillus cereus group]OUB36137.1 hypothetical protein BK708_02620 [Bacillus thuringiensis serovar yunnanensis]PEO49233.1 hypothetical protein CN579_29385 [Bacillus toyonensis]PGA70196.1 hypothetical protein COL90_30400 [Bacillus toyonensis]PGG85316.1 hypothetical protein CON73_23925 [Bacillus toyonensis]PGO60310.1 hypothetical protein CN980_30150 [Bacillus cereus]
MNIHEIYMEALEHEEKQCEKWELEILKLQQELNLATTYLQHHKNEHNRLQNIINRQKHNNIIEEIF